MKLKINEWLELSARKDLQSISANLSNNARIGKLINIDLLFALLTIVFDSLYNFSANESIVIKNIIKIILILFSVITICLIIYTLTSFVKEYFIASKAIKQKKVNIEIYVSNFDNKICYDAMVALSYMETYYENNKEAIDTDKTPLVKKTNTNLQNFCLLECDYYIYKCLSSISDMKNFFEDIIGIDIDETLTYKKIDYTRMVNILCILNDVRTFLKNNGYSSQLLDKSDKCADKIIIEFKKVFENNPQNSALAWNK